MFYGLHAGHGRGHLIRAVVEGVTFALRDSLDLVRGLGVQPQEATAVGGGARSEFWRQVQADIYGQKVTVTNASEGPAYGVALLAAAGTGAAYGAAMLAAVAGGQVGSVSQTAARWLRPVSRQETNVRLAEAYETAYRRYRGLYPRLKRFFAENTS